MIFGRFSLGSHSFNLFNGYSELCLSTSVFFVLRAIIFLAEGTRLFHVFIHHFALSMVYSCSCIYHMSCTADEVLHKNEET